MELDVPRGDCCAARTRCAATAPCSGRRLTELADVDGDQPAARDRPHAPSRHGPSATPCSSGCRSTRTSRRTSSPRRCSSGPTSCSRVCTPRPVACGRRRAARAAAPTSPSASARRPDQLLPAATAATATAATCSGVWRSGAAFMPSVIFVCTKPGPHDRALHAGGRAAPRRARGRSRRSRPWSSRRRSSTGADPLAGHRRQRDDLAVALLAQPVGQRTPTVHRRRVVHLGQLAAPRACRSRPASWSPSRPNATSGDVDVAVGERLARPRRRASPGRGRRRQHVVTVLPSARSRGGRVVQPGDRPAASTTRSGRGRRTSRRSPARSRTCHRAAAATGGCRRRRSQGQPSGQVGGEDARRGRRRRGPCATRRCAGTCACNASGWCASPWPGRAGRPRRAPSRPARSQSSCRPGSIGKSTHSVQPGIGNDSGARLPSPNRLSTFRRTRARSAAIIRTASRSVLLGAERHDELVLQEAVRAVHPVPLADDVQRVEERGDVLHRARPSSAPCGTRARRTPSPVSLLTSPCGNTSGSVSNCGASNFSGSRPQLGRQVGDAWRGRRW